MRNDQKVYKKEQFCVENGDFVPFCKANGLFLLERGGSSTLNNVYYGGGLYGKSYSDNSNPRFGYHGNVSESHGLDCAVKAEYCPEIRRFMSQDSDDD